MALEQVQMGRMDAATSPDSEPEAPLVLSSGPLVIGTICQHTNLVGDYMHLRACKLGILFYLHIS